MNGNRGTYLFLCIFLLLANMSFGQEFSAPDSILVYQKAQSKGDYLKASRMAIKVGDHFMAVNKLTEAKTYYFNAQSDAETAQNNILEARATFKIGMIDKKLAESGSFGMDEEQELLRECIRNMKKAHGLFVRANMSGSYEDVQALLMGGEAEFVIGDYKESVKALKIALRDAQKSRYNDLALASSRLLVSNYTQLNDQKSVDYYNSVHQNYQEFFMSKDSLVRKEKTIEKLATTAETQEVELNLKQTEIENKNLELENQRAIVERNEAIIKQSQLEKRMMIGGLGMILIFLIIAIIANQYKKKTNRKLEAQNKQILKQKSLIEKRQEELKTEKEKTDRLLLNILPKPIAEELKHNKRVVPRYYKKVTVIFTDFKGFTRIAANMSPGEVVKELEACFTGFDRILSKYGVEKIKTIGDGYMAAGGVPLENDTNPVDVVKAALEMLNFIEQRKHEKIMRKEPFFEVRIGINTGPVVAGVVGVNKFAYDIWGDTVNLASRMESGGEVGKVNISGETYRYVKDDFFFTYRGKINAKNRGDVDMFFVEGRVRYAGNSNQTENKSS